MDLYGPALPPGYVKPDCDESEESEGDTTSHEKQSERSPKILGPQRPDFLREKSCDKRNEPNSEELAGSETRNSIGPVLPASLQKPSYSDDDEDCESYGPIPNQFSGESDLYDQKAAIEKRAENMRNKLENKYASTTETLQREEWMIVPDTSSKNQLAAISQCLAPQKPSSKEKHHHRHSEKDKKTTEELKKYNKSKRSESLLDMHKKSLKKKSKEKNKPKERTAFDRDEIGVKQFSKHQVNTIVDKAKYLNSRFGAGSQQYL